MIYKVHEGFEICWPDGTVRAKAGEVFDGLDTRGTRRSRDFASAILARYRDAIYPTDAPVDAGEDLPPGMVAEFELLAGGLDEARTEPPKPKPKPATKKRAAKPKPKAPETPERLGDPEE